MKIQYFFKEIALFFAVFLCFVLPSLLQNPVAERSIFFTWTFPIFQILMCAASVLLLCVHTTTEQTTSITDVLSKTKNLLFGKSSIAKIILSSVAALFFLCFFMLIFQVIGAHFSFDVQNQDLNLPSGAKEWLFAILFFVFSAALEEHIFRIFFPSCIFRIVTFWGLGGGCESQKKSLIIRLFKIASEIVSCVLFALCHRYLGFFAVLNAIFAHVVLRASFLRSKSCIPNYISHTLYNLIVLLCLKVF